MSSVKHPKVCTSVYSEKRRGVVGASRGARQRGWGFGWGGGSGCFFGGGGIEALNVGPECLV